MTTFWTNKLEQIGFVTEVPGAPSLGTALTVLDVELGS